MKAEAVKKAKVPTRANLRHLNQEPLDEEIALPESDGITTSAFLGLAGERASSVPSISTSEVSAKTAPPGVVIDVPLTLLVEDPFNARETYAAEMIDDMSTQLASGQDVPIAAYWKEGKLSVIDGVKRLKGARNGGLQSLRVEVKEAPATNLVVYLRSRRMNLQRSQQTALDDASRWKKLIDEGLVDSQKDLAQQMDTTESIVSRVLSINLIPKEILVYMRLRPRVCGFHVAYPISQIFTKQSDLPLEVRLEVATQVIDAVQGGIDKKDVNALIASRLGEKKTRIRGDLTKIRFAEKSGVIKTSKAKGKVDFSISGLTADQVGTVEQMLVEMFSSNGAAA